MQFCWNKKVNTYLTNEVAKYRASIDLFFERLMQKVNLTLGDSYKKVYLKFLFVFISVLLYERCNFD